MQAYDVIQICRTSDGVNAVDCRLVPADGLIGNRVPSLVEAMPVILAVAAVWAVAWGIRQIVRLMQRS